MAAVSSADNKWACPTCTFENILSRQSCEMCETQRPQNVKIIPPQQIIPQQQIKPAKNDTQSTTTANAANTNASTTFKFKKFMGNTLSTTKLFAKATPDNNPQATKPAFTSSSFNTSSSNDGGNKNNNKSTQELLDEIEILKMQKDDLRKLVQERTYQLDQLKKLDGEHHKLRQRWQENEEKAANQVKNITAYSEEMKKELQDLKQQNAVLQSKSTNNDLIKNKLENKLREQLEENTKQKKLMERKTQEKKMLVAEVLKLRNEKQELISLYKTEIEKLNLQNTNNYQQLQQLHEQQKKSQQIEFDANLKAANNRYDELNLIYKNYKHNITEKISNINSTTNAFEAMINNANVGNLSQEECNKILDNIINSIETMERENEKYHEKLHEKHSKHSKHSLQNLENDENNNTENGDNGGDVEKEEKIDVEIERDNNYDDDGMEKQELSVTPGSEYNYKVDMDEDMLLNRIESRVLKTLREKALLQRSTNELMFQLQQLQTNHEQEIREKDEVIRQHEIRAKVSFFKKKQPAQ